MATARLASEDWNRRATSRGSGDELEGVPDAMGAFGSCGALEGNARRADTGHPSRVCPATATAHEPLRFFSRSQAWNSLSFRNWVFLSNRSALSGEPSSGTTTLRPVS